MQQADAVQQRWLSGFLRDETVGGVLMIIAAVAAMVVANSPTGDWYATTAAHKVHIPAIGLHMSIAHIAADFLLAFFFLIAGAELKHELVLGSLNSVKRAMTPVAGAVGGMLASALVFSAVCALLGGTAAERRGWAIPTSTDIAFALAILAIIGRRSAPGVRILLLSIAIINDLGSIVIIGSVFSTTVHVLALAAAGFFVFIWWVMQQLGVHKALVYAPVFLLAWYFMHTSGIHATVAGMALGLATKATRVENNPRSGVEQLEHWLRPVVAGFAFPEERNLATVAGLHVTVDAVVRHIQLATDKPLRERQVPFQGGVEVARPVQEFTGLARPEAFEIPLRLGGEAVVRGAGRGGLELGRRRVRAPFREQRLQCLGHGSPRVIRLPGG